MKTQIDKTIIEVWKLKEKAYQETKDLSGKDYFAYLRSKIAESFPHLQTASSRKENENKTHAVAKILSHQST